MKKIISFIVCSNGYGHLKRVISVVNQLNKLDHKIHSIIFINKTHINIINKESNFLINDKKRVTFNTDLSKNEPLWNDHLSLTSYNKWQVQLSENEFLKKSNLIVSDNYISPLGVFDNVILMGSFLWIDIKNEVKNIDKIINYEKTLITEKKPYVLCQKDLVMKSIVDKTKPFKLPWFCNDTCHIDSKSKIDILFTGGGTKSNNDKLVELIKSIHSNNNNFNLYVDKNLYKYFFSENSQIINEFDFTEKSFKKLKYVVCRPGMGILTECINYYIVPITLNFNDNNEMIHNSNLISKLKLGYSVDFSSENITHELQNIFENDKMYELFLRNIKNQLKGGNIEAAKTIISMI